MERSPLLRSILALYIVDNERGIRGRNASSGGLSRNLISKHFPAGKARNELPYGDKFWIKANLTSGFYVCWQGKSWNNFEVDTLIEIVLGRKVSNPSRSILSRNSLEGSII